MHWWNHMRVKIHHQEITFCEKRLKNTSCNWGCKLDKPTRVTPHHPFTIPPFYPTIKLWTQGCPRVITCFKTSFHVFLPQSSKGFRQTYKCKNLPINEILVTHLSVSWLYFLALHIVAIYLWILAITVAPILHCDTCFHFPLTAFYLCY